MKKRILLLLSLAFTLVLVACGGDNGSDNMTEEGTNGEQSTATDSTGNTLDIIATNFEFDQEQYTVKAGEPVTVNFKSTEGMHGISIDGLGVTIKGDGSATFTPEPGEYRIYCNILCGAGHAEMISTLVVQ